jgi:hypothetical protein
MPFSFLNPWFLLGALAIAAPIWLHLRRKTETNLIRFSALRFLDDNPQPRTSPLRLQELLLFALRVLALLLVVGAFAWPYLRDKEQVVVKESRVYILDNTLSHQAGSGFVQDRNRIADEVRQAGSGSGLQTAVIELTGQPRVVAGFAEEPEEARRKVLGLAPSFQRGAYLAAFRQAHALLASSLGEQKRIIFCTDSQENQWSENLSTPPFLRHTPVDLPKPALTNAPNVSLSEPRLQRVFLGDKSLVNFTVRLTHSGASENARVVLRANGQMIFSRTVELTNRPGAILLQGQWETVPDRWLEGVVSVEAAPDSLAGDNQAFFTLPPVREGRVAILALSPYLRLALSPEIMRGHWQTRLVEPSKLAAELADGKDAEVLVIESSYLQSAEARQLVDRYLSNGRGVFLLVNRASPVVNAALRDLGVEIVSSGLSEPSRGERLHYIFSNHAIFHPFLSPDYGNLLEVTVGAHPRLKPLQAMPLVFSESGEPLFFQGTKFQGRLFVAAFGFEREQTSWPIHVTFIPFLDLCLQNARPADATPLDYEPGALSVLSFPSDSSVREVVLRDGQRELQRVPVALGKAQVRLPDQPGFYAISYDGAAEPDKVFSVNPSPKESQLSYLDSPEALKLWQLEGGDEKASVAQPPVPAGLSLGAILQQHIWWWLLVAGLAALLLEAFWTSAKRKVV